MAVDGEAATTTEETNGDALSRSSVERAASIALGSAAAKASALAKHEDARISQLVSRLVTAQCKKVELKLTMFERLEEMLESEKRKLEVGRQELFKEKLQARKSVASVEAILKKAREGEFKGVESGLQDVKSGMTGGTTVGMMKEAQGVPVPERQEGSFQQL